jgi:hypothetical protein
MVGLFRSFPDSVTSKIQDPEARQSLLFAVASVVVGLSLFFPRPQNFAPIGALGLFAGAYARARHAWLFPVGALAIHTIAIGGYHWVVLGSVALGFSMSGFIGQRWIRHRVRPLRIGVGAVCTGTWFFLISNLGSWVAFGLPRGETLLHHYTLGLPFYWNTLLGDLFFSAVLFGGLALFAARNPKTVGQGARP